MIPTLSDPSLLKISETNLLALKILLGAISSANILLETSMAKTISTPSLFTVFNSVPIFGLTKPNTKMEIISKVKDVFIYDLVDDSSGLKKLKVASSKYFLIVIFCQYLLYRNTNKIIGNKINIYKYVVSSN